MHNLPLELHSQIFELACSDDGSTGRSLALVSRYVRDVAEPFLYQSLAVAGLGPMTELLTRLEQAPLHKRRVRRLFLSDWSKRQVQQKCTPTDDADMERYELERSIIIRVLDLIAPTIRSLTFVVSCPFNSTQLIGHLFSLRLLRLRDLSVHGFYPFPHLPHVMPSLETLHLSGNRNPHGLLQTGALGEACPRLTRVLVSGLISASSFAEELAEALLPDSCPQTRSLFSAAFPPCISEFVVQVGPAPVKARRYSTAHALHEKMLERFVSIAKRPDSLHGVQLTILDHPDEDVYESLHREWKEKSA